MHPLEDGVAILILRKIRHEIHIASKKKAEFSEQAYSP